MKAKVKVKSMITCEAGSVVVINEDQFANLGDRVERVVDKKPKAAKPEKKSK